MASLVPLDNGAVVWTLPVGALLGFDGWLVRTGRPSLSEHADRHPAATTALLAYLALHLLGRRYLPASVRRLDPLAAAARRLTPKAGIR